MYKGRFEDEQVGDFDISERAINEARGWHDTEILVYIYRPFVSLPLGVAIPLPADHVIRFGGNR